MSSGSASSALDFRLVKGCHWSSTWISRSCGRHFLQEKGMARVRRMKRRDNNIRNDVIEQQAEPISMPNQSIGEQQCEEQVATNQANKGLVRKSGTYMTKIWGRPDKRIPIKIICNKFGQPIGNDKKTLTKFLGSIARNGRYALINIKSWHDMPQHLKDDMFNLVQERFVLPPGFRCWIEKSLSRLWRNWKSSLRKDWYDPNKSPQSQNHCGDERVIQSQWMDLVTWWNTPEGKAICAKNKDNRSKKKMNHKTGKRSFGQVYDELQKEMGHSPSRVHMFKKCYTDSDGNPSSSEVANFLDAMNARESQLPPGSEDILGPNDIFSQVIGPDRSGRVRMCGFGVAPSDAWGKIPSRNTSHRIIEEQQQKLSRMEEQLAEQAMKINELRALMVPQVQNASPRFSQAPSFGSNPSVPNTGTGTLRVHESILLLSLFDNSKVVASGRIQNIDPSYVVGSQPLGDN